MGVVLKPISLLVILCFSSLVTAQENKRIKRIIKSVGDTVINNKEFDTKDSLIFEKKIQFWDDHSEHVFLDGFVYENDRVAYEYHATKDFLRLIHYEYDSVTGLREQLVGYTKEHPVNNERLHSMNDKDELIALVESVIPKHSKLTNILDTNESHSLVKKGRREIYTRYEDNLESLRCIRKYDGHGNLVFLEDRNEWQTTTTKCKYNRKNQLQKQIFGFDDYLSKTQYYYEDGLLVKAVTKLKDGRTNSTEYFYADGLLIREVFHKPEGDKIYEYSYEYFD